VSEIYLRLATIAFEHCLLCCFETFVKFVVFLAKPPNAVSVAPQAVGKARPGPLDLASLGSPDDVVLLPAGGIGLTVKGASGLWLL
jgi:hypothetical protein